MSLHFLLILTYLSSPHSALERWATPFSSNWLSPRQIVKSEGQFPLERPLQPLSPMLFLSKCSLLYEWKSLPSAWLRASPDINTPRCQFRRCLDQSSFTKVQLLQILELSFRQIQTALVWDSVVILMIFWLRRSRARILRLHFPGKRDEQPTAVILFPPSHSLIKFGVLSRERCLTP